MEDLKPQAFLKETQIVSACVSILKHYKIFAWRQNNVGVFKSGHFGSVTKGVPDILGMLPCGRFLGIECKSEKGKLSPHQIIFKEAIQKNNGMYLLIKNPIELIDFCVELKEKNENKNG